MDKKSLSKEIKNELESFEIFEKDTSKIVNRYEGIWKNRVFRDLLKANKKRDKKELEIILGLLDNCSEKYVLSIVDELALLYGSADYIADILSNLENEEDRLRMFSNIILYKAITPEEDLARNFFYMAKYIRKLKEKT